MLSEAKHLHQLGKMLRFAQHDSSSTFSAPPR